MKILCVCSRGNSRSVGLGWILKDHMGHDAIAMGIHSNSDETKHMLFKWAERIIIVDKDIYDLLPVEFREKTKLFDVGGDRYFRGFDQELVDQFVNYINTQGL